jgi:hypothetical protein
MSRMIRGPSRASEALNENVEEFVRVYTPSTEPLPERAFRVIPAKSIFSVTFWTRLTSSRIF